MIVKNSRLVVVVGVLLGIFVVLTQVRLSERLGESGDASQKNRKEGETNESETEWGEWLGDGSVVVRNDVDGVSF